MRRSLAVLAALSLALVVALPVQAAGLQRSFRAAMGSSGANGTIRIDYHTDGTGTVVYDVKGLRRGVSYRVEVWKGKCGGLSRLVTRIPGFSTNSSGAMTRTRALSVNYAYPVWAANWSATLAVRIVNGASIKCGNLGFTRATRVVVPGYHVDLPIVRGPSGYPYCNVAMYMPSLSQPLEPGVSFIYAHARTGMFLPLLQQYRANGGRNLIGKQVYVYTSASMRHVYQITSVVVMKSVQSAAGITSERLWLQTSTGPNFTYPKLVIKATRISSAPTTYAASHPAAKIVKCG